MRATRLLAASALILLSTVAAVNADWPKRVFAPYMYCGSGDGFKLADGDKAGIRYYTLAFIIADQKHEAAWDGQTPMSQNLFADQIAALRKRGGDVICSFGGQGGVELAIDEKYPQKLQAEYQAIIDRYKFTWLDFDIEGASAERDFAAVQRRNGVLAALQKKNPGLIVSFTLPADPNGLPQPYQKLVTDAKAQGVAIHAVNLMVMYFGDWWLQQGKSESELAITVAKSAHDQTSKIDPAIQIGLCPCVGKNGSGREVFTLADAKNLKAFADKTPWVCWLTYWSINRDAGRGHDDNTSTGIAQQPWDFANVFKSFGG